MRRLARLRAPLQTLLLWLAELAGLTAITFGAWLAWHPLGYIVGGVLVLVALFLLQGVGA